MPWVIKQPMVAVALSCCCMVAWVQVRRVKTAPQWSSMEGTLYIHTVLQGRGDEGMVVMETAVGETGIL